MKRNRLLFSFLLSIMFMASAMAQTVTTLGTITSGHPDGPYIFYGSNEVKVVQVDNAGTVTQTVYPGTKVPDGTTFTVTSDANDPRTGARSTFTVTLQSELHRPPGVAQSPDSLIVLSDVHAKWAPFVSILKAQHIIDNNLKWAFGRNALMIIGDVCDRGVDATTCYWLLYELQREARAAGGEVYFNLGNHDEMRVKGSSITDYVDAKYIRLATLLGGNASFGSTFSTFNAKYFDANTEMGRWFRDGAEVIQIIGKEMFMHGGISPSVFALKMGIDEINTAVAAQFLGTSRTGVVATLLNSTATGIGAGGLLWYRGMVQTAEYNMDILTPILQYYNIQRVVIGHCEVQATSGLETSNNAPLAYLRFDRRVVNVNVQTANAMAGNYGRGALILKNGNTFAIYDTKPNTEVPLPTSTLPGVTDPPVVGNGTGTEADPYNISTPIQLDSIRYKNGVSGSPVYFKLIADIDLTEYLAGSTEGWLPIGLSATGASSSFYTALDGNNHIIKGLWINRPTFNRVGLFAQMSTGGYIKNLGVEIDNAKGGIVAQDYVAGLLGYCSNSINIQNVYVSGNITGRDFVGGIVAYQRNSATVPFTDNYVVGSVSGRNSVGGISGVTATGSVSSIISHSYAAVAVTATGTPVGGIVGNHQVAAHSVENSYYDIELNPALNAVGNAPEKAVGAGKTTAALKAEATFTGWDFTNIWTIDEGVSYPVLKWQLPPSEFAGGTGTAAKPYLISNRTQLEALKNYLGTLGVGKHFKLTTDIDLSDSPWSPIATIANASAQYPEGDAFRGKLYGDGHQIKNISVSSNDGFVGLFGQLGAGAFIDDLHIVGGSIVKTAQSGASGVYVRVGSLAARIYVPADATEGVSITNCSNNATVISNGANSNTGHAVGGLIGEIATSSTTVAVNISSSFNAGNVTGGFHAGGIVGRIGLISATTATEAVVNITNCYSNATITKFTGINGGATGGGIVGSNAARLTIDKTYAAGAISNSTGTGTNISGGIAGTLGANGSIKNSVALQSAISGTAATSTNRVRGGTTGTLTNNYAVSDLVLTIGGVVEPKTSTAADSPEGADITAVQAKSEDFYKTTATWDFTDVWKIDEGTSYPYLKTATVIIDPTPIVQLLTPASNAPNVALDAVVSVTFDRNITAGVLSGVTISGATGVNASVAGNKITIAHGAFANSTEYTVTIPKAAIVDLANDIVWKFTTTSGATQGAYPPPTYSDGSTEYWYYIQFVSTGFVIEQHGAEPAQMTVELPVKDKNTQLWKVEFEKKATASGYTDYDLIAISSKADPTLKIRYVSTGGEGATVTVPASGFYAIAGSGSYGSTTGSALGNPMLLTNYNNTDYVTINARNSNYNIRPRVMGAAGLGSDVYRDGSSNPNKADCEIQFVPQASMFTDIKTPATSNSVSVYPNPASEQLFVELPGDAVKIYILNSIGQIVKQVKPSSKAIEEINISNLASGIYFLKIEKASGVSTAKFIVK